MPTIPLKDYIYLAFIATLLVAFGLWSKHERDVEHAKDVAADAKAVAVQKKLDDTLEANAAVATAINEGAYDHAITVPVTNVPVPVGLCHITLRSGTVSGPASGDQSGNTVTGSGGTDEGSTAELQRFANAAVQIARDSDAQVLALQADNAALRAEMGQKK